MLNNNIEKIAIAGRGYVLDSEQNNEYIVVQ